MNCNTAIGKSCSPVGHISLNQLLREEASCSYRVAIQFCEDARGSAGSCVFECELFTPYTHTVPKRGEACHLVGIKVHCTLAGSLKVQSRHHFLCLINPYFII